MAKQKGQNRAPLFETVLNHARKKMVSFHTPGHKNGRSMDPELRKFTGMNMYAMDVTVFPEVDSLHDPTGCIKQAEKLFAQAYGSIESLFLVNGSSSGNLAMFMSACNPGDTIILSRNAHKSALAGVILSGLWPVWIQPIIDQDLDIIFPVNPAQVEEAIKKFPEARAIFVTSPTYNGITSNLKEIAEIVHSHGKLLLVDEAHGAHLQFHRDLPVSALEAGADMCVQSVHKTLSCLSQGSVLHINSKSIDVSQVRKIVSMLQTTSPNYLILSSIDTARRQVFLEGMEMLSRVIDWTEAGRKKINNLWNFFSPTRKEVQSKGYDLDQTKLTVNVTRTGHSGHMLEDLLNEKYNIQVDCADLFNLIAIGGIGTSKSDITAFYRALSDIDLKYKGEAKNWKLDLPSLTTEMVMIPRDVFFMKPETLKRIPLKNSAGHISAQTLTPYPPGIPVLIPGERISSEIVNYLLDLSGKKVRIVGQVTEQLKTIKVVKT